MKLNAKPFNAREGDAVLIQEDNVKRNKWNIGIVEEFIDGRDGVIRGAAVRKIGGNGHPQIVHRPLQKLYPLEISISHDELNDAKDDGGDVPDDSTDISILHVIPVTPF